MMLLVIGTYLLYVHVIISQICTEIQSENKYVEPVLCQVIVIFRSFCKVYHN
jgi:hypothetical protein